MSNWTRTNSDDDTGTGDPPHVNITPIPPANELREQVAAIIHERNGKVNEEPSVNAILAIIEASTNKALQETAKAYGGCRKCYGKGYATVNDRWIGYDTDTDIGSPGGVIKGGNPTAMKFCTCSRGEQLSKLVAALNKNKLSFSSSAANDKNIKQEPK